MVNRRQWRHGDIVKFSQLVLICFYWFWLAAPWYSTPHSLQKLILSPWILHRRSFSKVFHPMMKLCRHYIAPVKKRRIRTSRLPISDSFSINCVQVISYESTRCGWISGRGRWGAPRMCTMIFICLRCYDSSVSMPVGQSTSIGSNFGHSIGQTGGYAEHQLTVNELSSHSHQYGTLKNSRDAQHQHFIDDPGHWHSATIPDYRGEKY